MGERTYRGRSWGCSRGGGGDGRGGRSCGVYAVFIRILGSAFRLAVEPASGKKSRFFTEMWNFSACSRPRAVIFY